MIPDNRFFRIVLFLVVMGYVGVCHVYAEQISQNPMTISAPEVIMYAFDGSTLEITVEVSGTDASVIVYIVKTGEDEEPPWARIEPLSPESRFVGNLDPIIYESSPHRFSTGLHVIFWDGKDTSGNVSVRVDLYRYYIFGYESVEIDDIIAEEDRATIWYSADAVISGLLLCAGYRKDYPAVHFTCFDKDSSSGASIVVDRRDWSNFSEPITIGDEIGIFSPRGTYHGGGLLYWSGTFLSLRFWVSKGMYDGEQFVYKIWDYQTGAEYIAKPTYASSDTTYNQGAEIRLKSLTVEDWTIVQETPVPQQFFLSRNHPNPFNPITSISFSLPRESKVTLAIYNTLGEEITTLADDTFPAGTHTVDWDARDFSSGIYFCCFRAGSVVKTRKLLLVK